MPGITAVISKPGFSPGDAHVSMVAAMRHEPFYTAGVFSEERLHVHVGWLAHAKSMSERMPVMNGKKDVILFFYGEEFSAAPASKRLQDASHLVELYERDPDGFLAKLNGWFSGILIDTRRSKVCVFNDRFGMERLYCHESKDAVYFATEAKSLLRVCPATRALNLDALAEHVGFNFTVGDKSLFQNISLLPAGSCWTFDAGGRVEKARYFSPETFEGEAATDERDAAERLERLFVDILPRYLNPHGDVAISLTGGLDTRIIAAAARNTEGMPAYTYAGQRDTFDVRKSREVAQVCGFKHSVIRLGDEFLKDFANLAQETVYISDGTFHVGSAHDLYCNRLARQIAPIRLTGLFGSEVLRQGRILPKLPSVARLMDPSFQKRILEAEGRVAEFRRGNPLTAALFRDIPWRGHGSMSIERSQVTMRSPFMDNDLVRFLYSLPNSARQTKTVQLEVIRKLNASLGKVVSDHGDATDRNQTLLALYRKFLWVLFKADYLYFFDTPRWLLAIEPALNLFQVPRLAFGFQKFEHYRVWFRHDLSDYVSDNLLDRRTLQRPFFDSSFLKEVASGHRSGQANYRNEIDKALSIELTVRTLIEETATEENNIHPIWQAAR